MRIGFYIGRVNYLGHFGPLIDYFRKKGAKINLFCDHRIRPKDCGYKAYQYPHPEKIREALNTDEVQIFYTIEEFVNIILENQVQVIFFLAFDNITKEAKRLIDKQKKKIVFASLQTGMDIVNGADLGATDIVYIFSENWNTYWKKWARYFKKITNEEQRRLFEQIDSKTVVSGFSQFDQLANFNRRTILEKYGLPKDKKIIVYLPFPWRVPFCVWSHIIYKPQNKIVKLTRLLLHGAIDKIPEVWYSQTADDLQVAKSIRQFADRNNAFFLVKARLKNKIPSYLKKLADKVIYDESYYPYTIMELMFVAHLCVHFYSDAVKESVVSDTPCICLGPTGRKDWMCYAERFFMDEFSPDPGSYYNFDGVVYNETVDDFAANFSQKNFDNYSFDMENKDRFVEKFLGYSDLRSSERIYNHIMNLLATV